MRRGAAQETGLAGGRWRTGLRSRRVLGSARGDERRRFDDAGSSRRRFGSRDDGEHSRLSYSPEQGDFPTKVQAADQLVEGQYVDPMLGRFVVSSVGRKAHIVNGLLDIVSIFEGEDIEWYYGEIVMQVL